MLYEGLRAHTKRAVSSSDDALGGCRPFRCAALSERGSANDGLARHERHGPEGSEMSIGISDSPPAPMRSGQTPRRGAPAKTTTLPRTAASAMSRMVVLSRGRRGELLEVVDEVEDLLGRQVQFRHEHLVPLRQSEGDWIAARAHLLGFGEVVHEPSTLTTRRDALQVGPEPVSLAE